MAKFKVGIDVNEPDDALEDFRKLRLKAERKGGIDQGVVIVTVQNDRDKKKLTQWMKKNDFDLDDFPKLKEDYMDEKKLKKYAGLKEKRLEERMNLNDASTQLREIVKAMASNNLTVLQTGDIIEAVLREGGFDRSAETVIGKFIRKLFDKRRDRP